MISCYNKDMEKTLTRVPYNEKRLQFLDATLPFLVLKDGRVVYNFEYYSTPNATFIRELNEFNAPIVPSRMWNFKGDDLTSYYNTIVELEYDKAVVYEACKDYYSEDGEDVWNDALEQHTQTVLAMDGGVCEAREILEAAHAAEKAEQERRQALMQSIADATAQDEDALPSPEVMQLRLDAGKDVLTNKPVGNATPSGITVETPKIITNLNESAPTKLIL